MSSTADHRESVDDVIARADSLCLSLHGHITQLPTILADITARSTGGEVDSTTYPDLVQRIAHFQSDIILGNALLREMGEQLTVPYHTDDVCRLYDMNAILATALNEAEDVFDSAAAFLVDNKSDTMTDYALPVMPRLQPLVTQASQDSAGSIASTNSATKLESSGLWNPRVQTSTIANLTLAHIAKRQQSILIGGDDIAEDVLFISKLQALDRQQSLSAMLESIDTTDAAEKGDGDKAPTSDSAAAAQMKVNGIAKISKLIKIVSEPCTGDVSFPEGQDVAMNHNRLRANAALVLAKQATTGDVSGTDIIEAGGLHAMLRLAQTLLTEQNYPRPEHTPSLPLHAVALSVVCVLSASDNLTGLTTSVCDSDASDPASNLDTVLHCIASALDIAIPTATSPANMYKRLHGRLLFEIANSLTRLSAEIAVNSEQLCDALNVAILETAPAESNVSELLKLTKAGAPSDGKVATASMHAEGAWSSALRIFQARITTADINSFGARVMPLLVSILDAEMQDRETTSDLELPFNNLFEGAGTKVETEWWLTQAKKRALAAIESIAAASLKVRRAAVHLLGAVHTQLEKASSEGHEKPEKPFEGSWRYIQACCSVVSPPTDARMMLLDYESKIFKPYLPFCGIVELVTAAAATLRCVIEKPGLASSYLARPQLSNAKLFQAPILAPPTSPVRRMESAPERDDTSSPRSSGHSTRLGAFLSLFSKSSGKDGSVALARTRSASDAPRPRGRTAAEGDGGAGRRPSLTHVPVSDTTPTDALQAWELAVAQVVSSGLFRALVAACTNNMSLQRSSAKAVRPIPVRPPPPPTLIGTASKSGRQPSVSVQEILRKTMLSVTYAGAASNNIMTRRALIKNGGIAALSAFSRQCLEDLQMKRRNARDQAKSEDNYLNLTVPTLTRTNSTQSQEGKSSFNRRGRSSTEAGQDFFPLKPPVEARAQRKDPRVKSHKSPVGKANSNHLRRIASLNRLASATASTKIVTSTTSEIDAGMTSSAAASDSFLASASGSENDLQMLQMLQKFGSAIVATANAKRMRAISTATADADDAIMESRSPSTKDDTPGIPPRIPASRHSKDTTTYRSEYSVAQHEQLLMALSALSDLSNILSDDTLSCFLDQGGLFVLIAMLLFEEKHFRGVTVSQALPEDVSLLVNVLSALGQVLTRSNRQVARMMATTKGFLPALAAILKYMGPDYCCMLRLGATSSVPTPAAQPLAATHEADLHISFITAHVSASLVDENPEAAVVASFASCIPMLLLLTASTSTETSRRSLEALVNITKLQKGCCTRTTSKPHPPSNGKAEQYMCLCCGFQCSALDASVSLVLQRLCSHHYGITSASPLALSSYSYASDAHAVTNSQSACAETGASMHYPKYDEVENQMAEAARQYAQQAQRMHFVSQFMSGTHASPPLLSYFVPNGVISPAIAWLLPASAYGLASVFVALLPCSNMMLVEHALGGLSGLLGSGDRLAQSSIATYALPFLGAMAADPLVPAEIHQRCRECLSCLQITISESSENIMADVLEQWRLQCVGIARKRAHARRVMYCARAWESAATSKAWAPVRLQLQEMDTSVLTFARLLENAGARIDTNDILATALNISDVAPLTPEEPCGIPLLNARKSATMERLQALRNCLIHALRLERIFTAVTSSDFLQKEPSLTCALLANSFSVCTQTYLHFLRKPLTSYSAVPDVHTVHDERLFAAFSALSGEAVGVTNVGGADDDSADEFDDRSSIYSGNSHHNVSRSLTARAFGHLAAATTRKLKDSQHSRVVAQYVGDVFPSAASVEDSNRLYTSGSAPDTLRPSSPVKPSARGSVPRTPSFIALPANPILSVGSDTVGSQKYKPRAPVWTLFGKEEPAPKVEPQSMGSLDATAGPVVIDSAVSGVNQYFESACAGAKQFEKNLHNHLLHAAGQRQPLQEGSARFMQELSPVSLFAEYLWTWDLLSWTCERVVQAANVHPSKAYAQAEKEASKICSSYLVRHTEGPSRRIGESPLIESADHATADGYESSESGGSRDSRRQRGLSGAESERDSTASSENSMSGSYSGSNFDRSQLLLPPTCPAADVHLLIPPGCRVIVTTRTSHTDTDDEVHSTGEVLQAHLLETVVSEGVLGRLRRAGRLQGAGASHLAAAQHRRRWKRKQFAIDIDEDEEANDYGDISHYANSARSQHGEGEVKHTSPSFDIGVAVSGGPGGYLLDDDSILQHAPRFLTAAPPPINVWLSAPVDMFELCSNTGALHATDGSADKQLVEIVQDHDSLKPMDFYALAARKANTQTLTESLTFVTSMVNDFIGEMHPLAVLNLTTESLSASMKDMRSQYTVKNSVSIPVEMHADKLITRLLQMQASTYRSILQYVRDCAYASVRNLVSTTRRSEGHLEQLEIRVAASLNQLVSKSTLPLDIQSLKDRLLTACIAEGKSIAHFFKMWDAPQAITYFAALYLQYLISVHGANTKSLVFNACDFTEPDVTGICVGLQDHWIAIRNNVSSESHLDDFSATALGHKPMAEQKVEAARSKTRRQTQVEAHASTPLRMGIDSLAIIGNTSLDRAALGPLLQVLRDPLGLMNGRVYLPPPVPAMTFPSGSDDMDGLVSALGASRKFSDADSDGEEADSPGQAALASATPRTSYLAMPYTHVESNALLATGELGCGVDGAWLSPCITAPSIPNDTTLSRCNSLIGLRHLYLSGNNLGDNGAADVIMALCGNQYGAPLESLDLSNNNIYGGSNVAEALTSVTGLFYNNSSLRSLSLASNPLSEQVVASILKTLGHAKHFSEFRERSSLAPDVGSRHTTLVPFLDKLVVREPLFKPFLDKQFEPPPEDFASSPSDAHSESSQDVTARPPRSATKSSNVLSWVSGLFGTLLGAPKPREAAPAPPTPDVTTKTPLATPTMSAMDRFTSRDSLVHPHELPPAASRASVSTGRSGKRDGLCTRLSHLNLSGCGLHSQLITDALDVCLRGNRTLRELDLSNNNLNGEAGARLAIRVEYHMPQLWFLRLSGNPLIKDSDRLRILLKLQKRRLMWLHPPSGAFSSLDVYTTEALLALKKELQIRNQRASSRIPTPVTAVEASAVAGVSQDPTNEDGTLAIRVPGEKDVRNLSSLSDSSHASTQPLSLAHIPNAVPPIETVLLPKSTVRVLIAAPLVLAVRSGSVNYRPLPALDYQKERKLLWNAFHPHHPTTVSDTVDIRFDFSTVDHLRDALSAGCNTLHLMCHGAVDWLAFEMANGEAHPLGLKDLSALLQAGGGIRRPQGGPRIRLLVLAACRSLWAAKLFHQAGIPYVVCIDLQEDVLDTACHTFVQHFYTALAAGHAIEYAFEVARQTVASLDAHYPGSEASKFVLLYEGRAHMIDGSVHDVVDLPAADSEHSAAEGAHVATDAAAVLAEAPSEAQMKALDAGEHPFDGDKVMLPVARFGQGKYAGLVDADGPTFDSLLAHLPPIPEHFIGRNVLCYHGIREVLTRRFFSLRGEKGIGKSAIAIFIAHWCSLRKLFADGVVYIDLRKVVSVASPDAIMHSFSLLLLASIFPDDWDRYATALQLVTARTADTVAPAETTPASLIALGSPANLLIDVRRSDLYTPSPAAVSGSPSMQPASQKFEAVINTIVDLLHTSRVLIVLDNADGADGDVSGGLWTPGSHRMTATAGVSSGLMGGDAVETSAAGADATAEVLHPLVGLFIQRLVVRTQHAHVMLTHRCLLEKFRVQVVGAGIKVPKLDTDAAAHLFGMLLGPAVSDGRWTLEAAKGAIRAVGAVPGDIISAAQQHLLKDPDTQRGDDSSPADVRRMSSTPDTPGADTSRSTPAAGRWRQPSGFF